MPHSVVLFDLDGTLIDSGAMILASMRHATSTVLRREISDEHLVAAIGGSTLREQMQVLDPARADELVASYRRHNEPLHAELQPCPGVLEVVERLHAGGRSLGIVTAKRWATVALAFDVLPLAHFFDAVVTSDDVARGKPHPDGIRRALELLGGRADDAVYVGDSPFDVSAAHAAGVRSVAVTWGGIHAAERLDAERPNALVSNAEELLAVL